MPPPSRFVYEVSCLQQVQPPAAVLAQLKQWFSAPLEGVTLPALHCGPTCKVLLPSSPADTKVMFAYMSKRADFTHPSSV